MKTGAKSDKYGESQNPVNRQMLNANGSVGWFTDQRYVRLSVILNTRSLLALLKSKLAWTACELRLLLTYL